MSVSLPIDQDVSDRFAGATWSPDTAIVTPRPARPLEDKAAISLADLAALVGATFAFGIAAWDDEGAVFWELSGSA